jgi:hypothetical protein
MARGWRQRNASPQSYSTFPTEEWENGDGEIVVDLTSRCPYSSEPIRSRGRKVGTLHTIQLEILVGTTSSLKRTMYRCL